MEKGISHLNVAAYLIPTYLTWKASRPYKLCHRALNNELSLPIDTTRWTLEVSIHKQKHEQYYRQHPRGSATYHFRGYRPFTKKEIQVFVDLSFISSARRSNWNQYLIFTTQSFCVTVKLLYRETDYCC